VMGRRVIEADGAADQTRSRASAAVPKDCIALADLLVPELVDSRRGRSGLVREAVVLPVRNEVEVAWFEPARLFALRRQHLPEVTTWKLRHPFIGGSASAQGAVNSERQ